MTGCSVHATVTRVAPGVAAIVLDEQGRILLHRRRIGDAWAPPSSPVAVGQSIEAALRECVDRETGLRVAVERIVGVYSEPALQTVAYPREEVHWITTVVATHILRGPVEDCDEGGPWRWFDPTALPEPLTAYAAVWIADATGLETAVLQ